MRINTKTKIITKIKIFECLHTVEMSNDYINLYILNACEYILQDKNKYNIFETKIFFLEYI